MVIIVTGCGLVLSASVYAASFLWGPLCVDVEGGLRVSVCVSSGDSCVYLSVCLLPVGLLRGGQPKSVA